MNKFAVNQSVDHLHAFSIVVGQKALLVRGRTSHWSRVARNVIEKDAWRPIVKRIAITMVLLQASLGVQAADLPVPIEAFAQLPRVSGAELSPDGKFFAYFRPVEGRRYMVVQPIDSSEKPTVIPPPGEAEFTWLRWANDERIVFAVAYSSKRGNTETTETRLLSLRYDATELAELIRNQLGQAQLFPVTMAERRQFPGLVDTSDLKPARTNQPGQAQSYAVNTIASATEIQFVKERCQRLPR